MPDSVGIETAPHLNLGSPMLHSRSHTWRTQFFINSFAYIQYILPHCPTILNCPATVNKIRDCANTKDPKKSRSLINSLLGKNCKSTYMNKLRINNNIITDSTLIAESLNLIILLISAQNWPTKLRLAKSLLMRLMMKMCRLKIVYLKIRVFILAKEKFITFTRP